ncbi:MAG TPA: deoxyribodipyrimidine photo-lyase [Terriglobales bacterium]|nr:deoxyribodipyrimidine photo-lyase [Terriglobales bacterium]
MSTIQKLENDAHVVVRRSGLPDPDGRCIVYWMRRSIRVGDNPSLDIAIQAANALGKPVVVFFALVPVANANLRHYTFLIEALADIPAELRERNVGFVLQRYPDHSVADFCSGVRAALLVTDDNPLRGSEHRLQTVVRQVRMPVWSVDSDVVVPSKLISGKQYAARIIRPKLLRLRDEFLIASRSLAAKVAWKQALKSLPCELSVLDGMKIDRSVQSAPAIRGGMREAKRWLREFVNKKLAGYPERRNHPEDDGTGRLSPYLHFGNISPVTIAREVLKADAPKEGKDAFLDQLITWRELSINFVRHNELYDSIECAEPWAARTLAKHAKDPRPVLYTEKQLENAETYDPLWNAAQIQMVEQGWMHNYMRMYWGKKILEWTRSPAEAFQIAVRLNDKYELDGRDPNGYAGIAWAIAGKLDRPWFERPIFGQIRYMSGASTGKKFDSKKYIAQHARETKPPRAAD